jgi:hypothetical protein
VIAIQLYNAKRNLGLHGKKKYMHKNKFALILLMKDENDSMKAPK